MPHHHGKKVHKKVHKADLFSPPCRVDGQIPVGSRLPVVWTDDGRSREAEVVQARQLEGGSLLYYVHYVGCDKRMDAWVPPHRMDHMQVRTRRPLEETQRESQQARRKSQQDKLAQFVDEFTRVKNIRYIHMGRHRMEAWYWSPFEVSVDAFPPAKTVSEDRPPEPRSRPPNPSERQQKDMWACEFCLKPHLSTRALSRHMFKCRLRHPPGDEIYRDQQLSFFEVDGKKQRSYCENLCLISKLFLEHKFLYYDVDPFMFYVLFGYFSKEKASQDGNNLACILTLPPFQQKGYGRILIELSYELSKKEGKAGSPEQPLSDLGERSYRSYWRDVLLEILIEKKRAGMSVSIQELTMMTCMKVDDIVSTLHTINSLHFNKRQHCLIVPDEQEAAHEHRKRRRKSSLDPEKLHWTPPPSALGVFKTSTRPNTVRR